MASRPFNSLREAVAADVMTAGASSPAWARLLTTPLSRLYGMLVARRNARFDRGAAAVQRLPGYVISVGNLVAGGTGKSPIAIKLAQVLLARGFKPAILTRGFGAHLKSGDSLAYLGGEIVMAPQAGPLIGAPDEARMQSAALPTVPVVVGPRRHAAASRFLQEHPRSAPTHWLLDDGFQHRQLARDLDLLLLDATQPFGNGRLLPRGSLREPVEGLRRAQAVIFTRAGDRVPDAAARHRVAQLAGLPTLTARFVAGPLRPLANEIVFDPSRHRRVAVVCGVARPDFLLDQLRGRGLDIVSTYIVGDHRPLAAAELQRHVAGAAAVVTTAKDYWRDPQVFAGLAIPVFVQELDVELDAAALQALLAPVLALR